MSIDYTSFSDDNFVDETPITDFVESAEESEIHENEPSYNYESDDKDDDLIIKVDNCEQVYIREKPTKDSQHVSIVSKESELLIVGNSEIDVNGELWHNVCTESGIEGYVMDKFTSYTSK